MMLKWASISLYTRPIYQLQISGKANDLSSSDVPQEFTVFGIVNIQRLKSTFTRAINNIQPTIVYCNSLLNLLYEQSPSY